MAEESGSAALAERLSVVRREIECMQHARLDGQFEPHERQRYARLCWEEQQLAGTLKERATPV